LPALLAVFAGCAQTEVFRADRFDPVGPRKRVLLLPADVTVTEMSLAGVETPQAEWSQQALLNLGEALERRLSARSLALARYDSAKGPLPELLTLGKVVGTSIMLFKYGDDEKLPTLESGFDWSLGPRAAELGSAYDADFGVVLSLRDGFATTERQTATVALAVTGLGGLPMPVQIGYAFLVDLRSGQVVWFNRMVFQRGLTGMADPRELGGAQETLDALLTEFPL
jgi:hypothetical protein